LNNGEIDLTNFSCLHCIGEAPPINGVFGLWSHPMLDEVTHYEFIP